MSSIKGMLGIAGSCLGHRGSHLRQGFPGRRIPFLPPSTTSPILISTWIMSRKGPDMLHIETVLTTSFGFGVPLTPRCWTLERRLSGPVHP